MIEIIFSLLFEAQTIYHYEAPTVYYIVIERAVEQPLAVKKDVVPVLLEEFGPQHPLIEIAKCESQLRHWDGDTVLRGTVNPQDIGLMQINADYHEERATELGYDIFTLEGNIGYARLLYEEQGSQPWYPSEHCWGRD